MNIFKNSIKYHSYVYFKWFPRHITIAGHSNFLKMYSQCMPASLIRTNKTVKTKPILISSSTRNRRKCNQCLPNKKRKYAHRKMPWELISSYLIKLWAARSWPASVKTVCQPFLSWQCVQDLINRHDSSTLIPGMRGYGTAHSCLKKFTILKKKFIYNTKVNQAGCSDSLVILSGVWYMKDRPPAILDFFPSNWRCPIFLLSSPEERERTSTQC